MSRMHLCVCIGLFCNLYQPHFTLLKKAYGQTDRQTDFQLYIVDYRGLPISLIK